MKKKQLRIGKYRVTGKLGAGTQGTVLLGVDNVLSREVAIKVLRGKPTPDETRRLTQEARIVSKLRHPNVVTLLDFGLKGGQPYLVFERLKGRSLFEEMQQCGALGLKRSVVLMSQILGGVATAHAAGIAHCDLSPKNIILTNDDLPKVMDFGLSSILAEAGSSDGLIAGTPAYMSPEHLRGEPLGFRSDVFALGAVFFEMLTGEKHFSQTSRDKLFESILYGKTREVTSINRDLPPLLDHIIGSALTRNRSRRYPTALEMKKELDKYRIPREEEKAPQHSTVEFLLRRLKHAPGFSAFSDKIGLVLKLANRDSKDGAKKLSNVLVRDVTLTQRVLSLANSAMNPGQPVTKLSRAIAWLGLDQVRNCVTACLLNSEFKSSSAEIKLIQVTGFYCAQLSRACVLALSERGAEDAFLSGMFHKLGDMLVAHYFQGEYSLIRSRSNNREMELTVSREILGLPYHQIGQQVGKTWALPETILKSMSPIPRSATPLASRSDELIPVITAYCAAVVDASFCSETEEAADVNRLLSESEQRIGIAQDAFVEILQSKLESACSYASLINAESSAETLQVAIHSITDFDQTNQKIA
ncbi:MAG: protein kinase [Pseudomonadota bacterium]